MVDHLFGKASLYEAKYRIQGKDGKYRWYYDRGKITQYDEEGKPAFLSGIIFDVTDSRETEMELVKRNAKLLDLATTDELTKIANRRKIMSCLHIAIHDADLNDEELTIALFDLDNFKKINDIEGHVVGDIVLLEAATLIQNSIRNSDYVGRYGGEEFLVIFPRTDIKKAAKVSERIRKAIEYRLFDCDVKVTISGGLKQYEGEEIIEFIRAADVNLYKAKNKGKNKIIFND